jgi:general secretion pathway protein K
MDGPLPYRWALNRQASVLVFTLWVICFLSTYAIILGTQVRSRISFVQHLDGKDRLRLSAEAGIKKAVALIREQEIKSYDSFNDTFSNNRTVYKNIRLSDDEFSVGYFDLNDITGKSALRYSLMDESGKININQASPAVLERLFRFFGLTETEAQELAASIVDWRDADSELTIPVGSAEDSFYRNSRYSYEAKDSEFEVLEELLLVKGMDERLFTLLKDYCTVYGDGKVNINTASKPVLVAVGLSPGMVAKILAFRYGKDETMDTIDDKVFHASGSIVAELSQAVDLSESEVAELSRVVDQFFTTLSNYFMIKSKATLSNRQRSAETVSVVDRSGKIAYWRES